jgi:hypothetical protein
MTFPICSSGSGENQKRAQKRGHSGLGLAVVAACTERLRRNLSSHLAESSTSHRDSLECVSRLGG